MGQLIDGKWWTDEDLRARNPQSQQGDAFIRQDAPYRNWVTKDGSAGPSGEGGFPAEKGRYHLYVSYACPWANRALIMRKLKGLEDMVGVSVVNPLMLDQGWSFADYPGSTGDQLFGSDYLYEVYLQDNPQATGKVTVPLLFDKKTGRIVSNESSEIIRMFNSAFDDLGARAGDYYPEEYREDIDAINDFVYDTINNGVYKTGFAKSQEVYDQEVTELFDALDRLEVHLDGRTYLVGDKLTEADIRLFVTLVRFDSVYFGHFKCNIRQLVDYDNLWTYTRRLYQMDEFKDTVNFDHIKNHYYRSHPSINPTRIVPQGPAIDWSL